MGRGLSDLQKNILVMAYQNRIKPVEKKELSELHPMAQAFILEHKMDINDRPIDLYTYEIKRDYFKFEFKPLYDSGKRYGGGYKFRPNEIGEKKYNSAKVAISKAITRLQQRGLVSVFSGAYSHWTGIKLTNSGEELAKELMANFTQHVDES